MIDEHEPKMKVQLICPKCGIPLIRVNEIKENNMVDCKWMCINPTCRKGLVFDTYYGYTQEDIDNQLLKDPCECPRCHQDYSACICGDE